MFGPSTGEAAPRARSEAQESTAVQRGGRERAESWAFTRNLRETGDGPNAEKDVDRPTFFRRAGDKQLNKVSCDPEGDLHKE